MTGYRIEMAGADVDLDEVIELVSTIYGPNYFDAKKIHGWLLRHEPRFSRGNFVIARAKNGDLVGIVRIVDREMKFGPTVLNCGGISTVGTHGDWRRKGVATELMEEANNEMRRKGVDLGLLHARRVLDGFYPRVGYWGINRYLHLEMEGSAPSTSELIAVPLQEENLDKLELSYDSVYGNLAGSIMRKRDMWEFLLGKAALVRPPFVPHECRVRDSGQFAGYVVVSGDTLHEAVIQKEYFSSTPRLFEELGVRYIGIHPFHPLFIYLRSTYSATLTERFAIDGGYMGKIINMESFLGKYAEYVRVKWQSLGMPFRKLRLCGLEVDMETGVVQRAKEDDDIRFRDQRTCLWFLLGILQPSRMAGVSMGPRSRFVELVDLASGLHTSSWDGF